MKTITVIGAGIMGAGIAHVAATGGYQTILFDISKEILDRAKKQIRENLQKGVDLGKLTGEQMQNALNHLTSTEDLRAAAEADFIIEAVPENIALKVQTFRDLHPAAPRETIFASNTSGLSITEMAAASGRPDRFIGMHFFNP